MSALNPKVSLDQMVIKSLYYRFKDFIVPLSTIGVCVLLFIFIILPQIQTWMEMRDAVSGDSQKLATLKQNLQIVSALDDAKLDADLQLASNALPTDKDFTSVLQALSAAAANAGTSLGDYNFQIGDLLGSDAKTSAGQLPLQLTINLKGDLTTGKKFIQELKKQLPLSDVTSVSVNANQTLSVTVVFYYASLPKITFDDSVPLTTPSKQDEEVLKLLNLSADDQESLQPAASPSPASPSAKITP